MPTRPGRQPTIFISYRRRSSATLALLLARELKDRGVTSFVDTRQTDGAGPFPDRLLRAIESSDVFVCLLADASFGSDWVLKEIEHAHSLGKPMIPVFQESYAAPNPIPNEHVTALLQSGGIQVLDIRNIYTDQAADDLAAMVKRTRRTVPRQQASSRFLLVAAAALVIVLLFGALVIAVSQWQAEQRRLDLTIEAGTQQALGGEGASQPMATATNTVPTIGHSPDNRVIHNTDWTPVMQNFR